MRVSAVCNAVFAYVMTRYGLEGACRSDRVFEIDGRCILISFEEYSDRIRRTAKYM